MQCGLAISMHCQYNTDEKWTQTRCSLELKGTFPEPFYDAHTWMEIVAKVQNYLAAENVKSSGFYSCGVEPGNPLRCGPLRHLKTLSLQIKCSFLSAGALTLSLWIHGSRTWDASAPGRRCLEGIFNLSEWRSGAKCIWEEEMTARLNHHLTPTCRA